MERELCAFLIFQIMNDSFYTFLRAVISFLYIYITSMARKEGVSGLFWIGVGSQAGAGLGSILAFVLTSMLNLFQSAPPC